MVEIKASHYMAGELHLVFAVSQQVARVGT